MASMDFAERLGLWLSAFDAVGLRAALEALASHPPPSRNARRTSACTELRGDLQRLREAGHAAIARPLDEGGNAGPGGSPAYAPFKHRHTELQRLFEPMVAGLREHARRSLSAAGGPLRRLAALDAAMAPVMLAREQALWPLMVTLMEKRFAQQAAGVIDMDAFTREWRQALQTELELRLAPVTGLVEAFENESDGEHG